MKRKRRQTLFATPTPPRTYAASLLQRSSSKSSASSRKAAASRPKAASLSARERAASAPAPSPPPARAAEAPVALVGAPPGGSVSRAAESRESEASRGTAGATGTVLDRMSETVLCVVHEDVLFFSAGSCISKQAGFRRASAAIATSCKRDTPMQDAVAASAASAPGRKALRFPIRCMHSVKQVQLIRHLVRSAAAREKRCVARARIENSGRRLHQRPRAEVERHVFSGAHAGQTRLRKERVGSTEAQAARHKAVVREQTGRRVHRFQTARSRQRVASFQRGGQGLVAQRVKVTRLGAPAILRTAITHRAS